MLNCICNIEHFSLLSLRTTLERAAPEYHSFIHRKAWEWAFGINGIEQLCPPTRDSLFLSIAGGTEAPIYYFSNYVKFVFAFDKYGDNSTYKGGENRSRMLIAPEEFAHHPNFNRSRIIPRWADARDLPLPDDTFDCVFSFSSIEHFGNPTEISRAASEMGRVLKPNGVLCIATEFSLNGVVDERYFHEMFTQETLQGLVTEPTGCKLVEPINYSISSRTLATELDFSWAVEHPEHQPHIVLSHGPNLWTSIIVFLRKPRA